MPDSKETKANPHKPKLGLGSGKKLGINPAPNSRGLDVDKFSRPRREKDTVSAKTGSTVVVVTRSKSKTSGGMRGGAEAGLTQQEHQKRLEALRIADKAKQTEKNKAETSSPLEAPTILPTKEIPAKGNEAKEAEESEFFANISGKKSKVKSLDFIVKKSSVDSNRTEEERKGESAEYKNKNKVASYLGEEREVVVNRKKEKVEKKSNKKMTISQLLQFEEEKEEVIAPRGIKAIAQMRKANRGIGSNVKPVAREKVVRDVVAIEGMTVQELANAMAEKAAVVIKVLMNLGVVATINTPLDAATAELVVTEFKHRPVMDIKSNWDEIKIQEIKANTEDCQLDIRPPIVTIMGHVDHGKTSLLDAYRQSKVVEGEAGGITQHIGAYQVDCNGHKITFLDTPGHAAFTAMRLRGAKSTDIIILIVAADDGVMEQTIEAINHAKAAKVPIIVAINKIDRPKADPAKVRSQLLVHDLVPEEMGGDVMVVEISATEKINLNALLEAILLQAEFLDLKVCYDRPAIGVVVETHIEKGKGIIATLLIKEGKLKNGDIMVAGTSFAKVKHMFDDMEKTVNNAEPSTPVRVVGFETAPVAGDEFIVTPDEKTAREILNMRLEREKLGSASKVKKLSLEEMFKSSDSSNKVLNIILKADTHGSAEAIAASLAKISVENIAVKVLHQGVGGITESDITLAQACNAIVIGFNVRANSAAAEIAKVSGIDIRYYSIIYELLDEIAAAAHGMLAPKISEVVTGMVEVREVFDLTKVGKVAGCYVTEGVIKKTSHVRLIRDNVIIHEGTLKALKRFKDNVKEVNAGFECGLSFERYDNIKVGDKVEAFDVVEEKR